MLDNIQRLKDKAKDGPLSLEEQRELDHNEKVLAQTRVKNLEKEQQVIRSLPQPRELDPVKAKALETERAILQRPVPGEPPSPSPKVLAPENFTRSSSGSDQLPQRVGEALSERPGGLATAVTEVSDHLNTQVPGLLHDKTQVFHSAEDLLKSDYAKEHPLSKEDLDKLHSAEGFFDPKTGHTAIIAGNVELRPGETPHDALTRVILHERVGHDGLQTLLGSQDSKAQQHWQGLTQRIKPEELDAIARQDGYQHLAGNHNALAHEWFARQVEKSPHLLKQPGLVRDMWEAFKGQLRKVSAFVKGTDESKLDAHLHELMRLSRKAALKQPATATAHGTATSKAATGGTQGKEFSLAYRARQQNQDNLAQAATQSILNHDNSTANTTTAGRHSDRPGGNTQKSADAVTSALMGGVEGTVPGWSGAGGQRRRAEWEREYLNRNASASSVKETPGIL